MGSDTPEKQELDPKILRDADRIIVDSLDQSKTRGEVFKAANKAIINRTNVIELGKMITTPSVWRQTDEEITVADLTGVAIQDIQISKAIYKRAMH